MSFPDKTYLGDSVYAEMDSGMIKLTTENDPSQGASNTIYLELEVVTALTEYIERSLILRGLRPV